jgi:Asp-tRNA(Asn)/Glu-tRNA(Gln) amidotransferase C subunit
MEINNEMLEKIARNSKLTGEEQQENQEDAEQMTVSTEMREDKLSSFNSVELFCVFFTL